MVRQALDEGYEVRCTVRPRQTPADFLRDWGATTVQVCSACGTSAVGTRTAWESRGCGPQRICLRAVALFLTAVNDSMPLHCLQADLTDPTSLPAALVGIHSVIDCATARPEESTMAIDWESKVALIQCAQAMSIQR